MIFSLNNLWFKHHDHDTQFINNIFRTLPHGVLKPVSNIYERTYKKQGRQAANLYLLSVEDTARGKSLLVADDDTLARKAKNYAKICKAGTQRQASAFCQSQRILPPKVSPRSRMSCAIWWERQLRRKQDREQELLPIQLGFVRKKYQPYASTALISRLQARHARSIEILKNFEAISDDGDKLDLLDVLKGSLGNAAVRRAELMVRMRGFEEYAKEMGHVAMFYTFTAPSRYHRYSGESLNPKYENFTPKETQKYFCTLWARITAKLHRDELSIYGNL